MLLGTIDSTSELVPGLLLFVCDTTSKSLTVSTAAAQERLTNSVFGSPSLEPYWAILRLRRMEARYTRLISTASPPHSISPTIHLPFTYHFTQLVRRFPSLNQGFTSHQRWIGVWQKALNGTASPWGAAASPEGRW
jgi:hypothetical protein